MVRTCIFILFLLLTVTLGHTQFSARLAYTHQAMPTWTEAIEQRYGLPGPRFNNSVEAGISYWVPLRKPRIEFLPEISYSRTWQAGRPTDITGAYETLLAGIHMQIYALDMEGDCDCPTFSRQGPSINKGLFFHFTPAAGLYQAKLEGNPSGSQQSERITTRDILYRAGLGIGLDLGVNDLLTITPVLSYYFQSDIRWPDLLPDPPTIIDQPRQVQFSLRLGFRPDYTRRYRR